MMHPMRVEWSLPDECKRKQALDDVAKVQSRMVRHRANEIYNLDAASIEFELASKCTSAERDNVWLRRFPGLGAEVVYFGTLLSVRYVPAQYAARHYDRGGIDLGRTAVTADQLSKSKWVALVATESGTKEMDPMILRVMWPMAPGDPIGGIVSESELARRAAK